MMTFINLDRAIRDDGKRVYHGKALSGVVVNDTLLLETDVLSNLPDGTPVNVSIWTEGKGVEHEA